MRALLLCFVTILAMAAGATFWVSYSVDRERAVLARLETEIAAEQQRIAVLRAEWAYLNRPARLARLASERLGMRPAQAGTLSRIGDLPFPAPAQPEPETLEEAPKLLVRAEIAPGTVAAETRATVAAAPRPSRKPARPGAIAQAATTTPPAPKRRPDRPAAAVHQAGYQAGGNSRLDAVLRDLAFSAGVQR